MQQRLVIIGGGLAGVEAAWQAAQRGVQVELHEMRPVKPTPAHKTGDLAELVCSNSLGSDALGVASGLLKAEMRLYRSLVLEAAARAHVPAGNALAVDRDVFAAAITERLTNHPGVTLHRDEVTAVDPGAVTIIATGPLTSEALAAELSRLTGSEQLFFFDAAAPIIERESLDMGVIFPASRYDKGEGVYLNCPFDKEQYDTFLDALLQAEVAPVHGWDQPPDNFFESCLPVEEIARRGRDTLRFGPMKPVGLTDPRTERRPYAVVQLRQDNMAGSLYNLVGFQTQLKWGEQKRVFRLIPGMAEAEFVRFGVMHRNTYVNSPKALRPTLQLRQHERVLVAGQLTGTEGYTESAAMGLIAGINAARLLGGQEPLVLPEATIMGALTRYITTEHPNFQPINSNWALLPPLAKTIRDKKERHRVQAELALAAMAAFVLQTAGETPAEPAVPV